MWKILAATVVCVVLSGVQVDAAQCCAAYNDFYGKYHETELCPEYCCLQLSLGKLLYCCDDSTWEAPSTQTTDDCLQSWVHEHIWVPIVGSILFLILVVGICTCCCCCCGCCRRSPAPVIIHQAGGPQTTVAMQQSTVANVQAQPVHYGYDQ